MRRIILSAILSTGTTYAILKKILDSEERFDMLSYPNSLILAFSVRHDIVPLYKWKTKGLLNKNPSINAYGKTLLHYASEKGKMNVCKSILELVEEKSPKDINGSTPLHFAAHYGNVDVAELLLDKAKEKKS